MVVPHIIHFNRIVHDKPTVLVIPHLCKPPYKAIDICCFDGVWPHPDIHPASSGEKLIRVSYSYGQGWSTPPRVLPFLPKKNTQTIYVKIVSVTFILRIIVLYSDN
jgi:hypothetical protein